MRVLFKLLLLSALAACGAPGSDAVFDTRKTKALAAESTKAAAPVTPPRPRLVTRQYSGYYRRMNDTAQFQPCGSRTVLDVFDAAQGRAALRERYRFSSPWPGATVFAVFNGAMVTDTSVSGSDTSIAKPRTRFFVAGVDSMRARRSADCSGMPPS